MWDLNTILLLVGTSLLIVFVFIITTRRSKTKKPESVYRLRIRGITKGKYEVKMEYLIEDEGLRHLLNNIEELTLPTATIKIGNKIYFLKETKKETF